MPHTYVWGYNDPTVSSHHVVELPSIDSVLNQFDILVNGLVIDSDPYRSIQFNVPALPPIMIEISELSKSVASIKKMLTNALINLPKAMTGAEVTAYTNNDESEEDEDEEEEDEEDEEEEDEDDEDEEAMKDEDEYADLPPLVPLVSEAPVSHTHGYFTRLQERLQERGQNTTGPSNTVEGYSYFA
jgi:hypothetical protein